MLQQRVCCGSRLGVAGSLPVRTSSFVGSAPLTLARPTSGRQVRSRAAAPPPPRALLGNLFRSLTGKGSEEEAINPAKQVVEQLLQRIEGTERGLSTSPEQRQAILEAVAELAELGSGATTTSADDLSATWRLLWTTEKETLFILGKAGSFGTKAGDVYQVIDVEQQTLQNVITFPPKGAFIVDSSISIAGPQRTRFQFSSAKLKLPGNRQVQLPPFGKGWFDTVYVDENIRVAVDSRGDALVVARDGPPRVFT